MNQHHEKARHHPEVIYVGDASAAVILHKLSIYRFLAKIANNFSES